MVRNVGAVDWKIEQSACTAATRTVRRMSGATRESRISNEIVRRGGLGVVTVVDETRTDRLWWFGRVMGIVD